MLIQSPRHTQKDLELWETYESADLIYYHTHNMDYKIKKAIDNIKDFYGTCYLGVSWGKDSVVVAHLVQLVRPETPMVWVRVEPIKNPDCVAVRDEFLCRFPNAIYDEVIVNCKVDRFGTHATGTLEKGFKSVYEKYGNRHISGVRSEESGVRRVSRLTHGINTERTCRPIIDWTQKDVFAYLAFNDLPVHPVYAMLGCGRWAREHIRVASLGGKRGDQFGRTVWEKEYYPDILRRTGQM
jgi:phosphoadenosine phosphosulfate reductase